MSSSVSRLQVREAVGQSLWSPTRTVYSTTNACGYAGLLVELHQSRDKSEIFVYISAT